MHFDKKTILHLRRKYHDVFSTLEHYDKTREWPLGKMRIDITLNKKTIRKLKELKEKTHKPISYIIEEAVGRL